MRLGRLDYLGNLGSLRHMNCLGRLKLFGQKSQIFVIYCTAYGAESRFSLVWSKIDILEWEIKRGSYQGIKILICYGLIEK